LGDEEKSLTGGTSILCKKKPGGNTRKGKANLYYAAESTKLLQYKKKRGQKFRKKRSTS